MTIADTGHVTIVSDISTSGRIIASSDITGNAYYCTSLYTNYTSSWSSTGLNGCFIPLNIYWTGGYCNLNICIYLYINGSWGYYWMGRIAVNGFVGGIIGYYVDCQSGGAQQLTLNNVTDAVGNNCIRVTNGNLSTYGGICYYKIYG